MRPSAAPISRRVRCRHVRSRPTVVPVEGFPPQLQHLAQLRIARNGLHAAARGAAPGARLDHAPFAVAWPSPCRTRGRLAVAGSCSGSWTAPARPPAPTSWYGALGRRLDPGGAGSGWVASAPTAALSGARCASASCAACAARAASASASASASSSSSKGNSRCRRAASASSRRVMILRRPCARTQCVSTAGRVRSECGRTERKRRPSSASPSSCATDRAAPARQPPAARPAAHTAAARALRGCHSRPAAHAPPGSGSATGRRALAGGRVTHWQAQRGRAARLTDAPHND
jgi:hypothetical protein